MDMKRIEAKTLEEAYKKASEAFNCSITEINYEIVQYPTTGVMGLFKKPAIIVVARKIVMPSNSDEDKIEKEEESIEQSIGNREEKTKTLKEDIVEPSEDIENKSETIKKKVLKQEDKVLDSFFENSQEEDKSYRGFDDDRDTPKNRALSKEIETKIATLMKKSCFDIDTIEVDVFNNIAHIFIDGEDAALLIGKEGYRYNALSYMLFNWINARYNLYIKLEIAEFIQSQEDMIVNYLKPIIEHIEQNGRGKTKPLDGILVQIALEQLRARFPNKYVAIKTAKDNRKFIIINNFNSSKNG
jgi:spoIIIJ-associated protein